MVLRVFSGAWIAGQASGCTGAIVCFLSILGRPWTKGSDLAAIVCRSHTGNGAALNL
jgi:hypothetical protein